MSDSNFNFDTIKVPDPIKRKLMDLFQSIEVTRQSRKGSNGWLFFGQNRISKQKVAIKFYDWGGDPHHAEPKYLATISSSNVIQILDASFVDDDYAYFLTPYFNNGDLDVEIYREIEGNIRAVSVVRDILSGLSYLHMHNLLHRDLKAQNILVDNGLKAVIGDFGSVRRIPQGSSSVPGSGHSLIYTPPESISSKSYGVPGDIYQVGILLFQMLGGALPYEESSWLDPKDLNKYRLTPDSTEKQIFATVCIKKKILRGKVADVETLPPWVCKHLRRIVLKACNTNPEKRYQTCSDFLANLNAIGSKIRDWKVENGCPTCYGKTSYRIVLNRESGEYFVEKNKDAGWRRDNSFVGSIVNDLVLEIDSKF